MKPHLLTQRLNDWMSLLAHGWGRLYKWPQALIRERLLSHITYFLPQHIPIATKLAATFTMLIASGMILIGLMVGTNQSHLLGKQMVQFGATLTHQLAESSKEPLLAYDRLGLELVLNSLSKQPDVLGTAALSEEGKILVNTGLVPPHNVLRSSGIGIGIGKSTHIEWSPITGPRAGTRMITFVEPVKYQDLTVGYTLVTFDQSLMSEARNDTVTTVIVTIILMI